MDGTLTRPRRCSLRGPVLVACTAAAGVLGLQVLDPTEPDDLPVPRGDGGHCPGSLRMLHDLGEGDGVAAAAMNPLALLGVVALVAGWAAWTRRVLTGRTGGLSLPPRAVWVPLLAVVVVAVPRNLPGRGLPAPG